jgi:hypothetical protein
LIRNNAETEKIGWDDLSRRLRKLTGDGIFGFGFGMGSVGSLAVVGRKGCRGAGGGAATVVVVVVVAVAVTGAYTGR